MATIHSSPILKGMKDENLFPPSALLDRGQQNDFERRVWEAYIRYREEEEYLRKYPNREKDTLKTNKEAYLQSGLDFDGFRSLSVNHAFWCAVKHDDVSEFIKAFNSRKVEKAVWGRHTFPSKSFRSRRYVEVLPPAAGMIFFTFHGFGQKFNHYQNILDTLHEDMSWISSWLGNCYCFWAEAGGLNSGYIKWADGGCVRAKSSTEDTHASYGKPFDDEENPDAHLWINDVYKTANSLGMNILKTRPLALTEKPLIWFIGLD